MDKRCFSKVLSFERGDDKIKRSSFIDKQGKNALVKTTWNGVIPGLRYNCKLGVGGDGVEKINDGSEIKLYKMQSFRLWRDKLSIMKEPGIVTVQLDEKIVDALTFDISVSSKYEDKVEELSDYFNHKEFQLRGRDEIAKFISDYEEACKSLYDGLRKKEKKKATFFNKIIKKESVEAMPEDNIDTEVGHI